MLKTFSKGDRMIQNYILEHYVETEPIFVSDLPQGDISSSALTQQLHALCEKGVIAKYDNGIYYIPRKNTVLNVNIGPTEDSIARYKYISDGKTVKGFYSGHTLANQLGLSAQVPYIIEIVSNNTSARYREVSIGKRRFIVRKSTITVDRSNVHVLQLLDFLKDADSYIDEDGEGARKGIYAFITFHHITHGDVDRYIRNYPLSVFRNYYELDLQNVLE